MLITFLSLVLALIPAVLAVVATMAVSYLFALGEGGMMLTMVATPVAGVWTFLYSFRLLRAYTSN